MEQTDDHKHVIVLGDNLPEGCFRIHSRFRDVVNFVNARNDIAFMTTDPDKMAANGICINGAALTDIDALCIDHGFITACNNKNDRNSSSPMAPPMPLNAAGYQKIDRNRAAIFNSTLCYHQTMAAGFKKTIVEIPDKYAALFPSGSMLFVLMPGKAAGCKGGFDTHFANRVCEAADCLVRGHFARATGLLKSSGRGLSPAGDDFIAGLLLGLHYNAFLSGKNLQGLADNIYKEALGTNLLVNAFLLQAKEDRCFALFKNFVFSLSQNKQAPAGLKKLLAMGATSGADLLSGYIFSVKHNLGI